jgi:cell division protein FtsI/penicillin-binding protein 2
MLKTLFKDLHVKRVLSTETADNLRNRLKLAASKQGTAPLKQVTGVEVAGKTATTIGGFWTDAETGVKVRHSDTAAFVGMLKSNQSKASFRARATAAVRLLTSSFS